MISIVSSKSFMVKSSARLSILSLVLGLGLAVLPNPFGNPVTAQAEDGKGVGEMYTVSESEVADSPAKKPKANTGSCEKDLPSNPTVTCGYIRFENGTNSLSLLSGAPQQMWIDSDGRFHGNSYSGQGLNDYINVYDPTRDPVIGAKHGASNGANTKYFAIGIWWQDKKYWNRKSETVSAGVKSNPRYKTVTRYRTEMVLVPTDSDSAGPGYEFKEKRVPFQVQVTNDPKLIIAHTFVDRINNRTSTFTAQLGPGASRETYKTTISAHYYGRSVNYGDSNFPKAPRTYTNECAAYIGPGYMTGPSANDATSPWPVPTGVGTYDPQTELKRWNTRPANAESNPYWIEDNEGGKLYSDAGMLFRDYRFRTINRQERPHLFPSYSSIESNIISAIDDCPDITYAVSAQDQDCVYLGQTFGGDYGKTFSKDSDYCSSFTPGNYRKEAEGYTATCQIGEIFWDPDAGGFNSLRGAVPGDYTYQKVFLGCDDSPSVNPAATVNDYDHFLCDDPNGSTGKNETYNFANCSGPRNDGTVDVADTYRCAAPNNGEPEIIDVESGNVMGDQSQILANGKQVQVRWPAPEGIAVLSDGVLSRVQNPDNPWMNWDVVDGSEPINDSLAIDDPNQKIFGNWRENVDPGSASSDLGGPGKDEWDTPWIYLRAYQGAPVNNEGSSVSVGDVTVSPEGTIPLGVTTTFNATVKRTVETGLGGTLEINVPVICNMPDAYLYAVSGRATD